MADLKSRWFKIRGETITESKSESIEQEPTPEEEKGKQKEVQDGKAI